MDSLTRCLFPLLACLSVACTLPSQTLHVSSCSNSGSSGGDNPACGRALIPNETFVAPILTDGPDLYAVFPKFAITKQDIDCSRDLEFELRKLGSKWITNVSVPKADCAKFSVTGEVQLQASLGDATSLATLRSIAGTAQGAIQHSWGVVEPTADPTRKRLFKFYVVHDPAPLIAWLLVVAAASVIVTAGEATDACRLKMGKVGWICPDGK